MIKATQLAKETLSTHAISPFPVMHASNIKMVTLCANKCLASDAQNKVAVFDVDTCECLSVVQVDSSTSFRGLLSIGNAAVYYGRDHLVRVCSQSYRPAELMSLASRMLGLTIKIVGVLGVNGGALILYKSKLKGKIHVTRFDRAFFCSGQQRVPPKPAQVSETAAENQQKSKARAGLPVQTTRAPGKVLKISLLTKPQKPAKSNTKKAKNRRKPKKQLKPKPARGRTGRVSSWDNWAIDSAHSYSWSQPRKADPQIRQPLCPPTETQRIEIARLTSGLHNAQRQLAELAELARAKATRTEQAHQREMHKMQEAHSAHLQQLEQNHRLGKREMINLARAQIDRLTAQVSQQAASLRGQESASADLKARNDALRRQLHQLRIKSSQSDQAKTEGSVITVEEHKARVLAQEVKACLALLDDHQQNKR